MNRHFINSVPTDGLGKRVEQEPLKKPEPVWRPASVPGYEVRTVDGKVETRPIRLDPAPAPPTVPVVPVVSTPTKLPWRTDSPPVAGWYVSSSYPRDGDPLLCSYWDGEWKYCLTLSGQDVFKRHGDGHLKDEGWTRVWQGSKLDLPAPVERHV